MTNSELDFAARIKQEMYNNKYILTYRGEISQQIILALLDMTERKLDSTNPKVNVKSRIFNVMVGCLQNISFHNDGNKYASSSMFGISQTKDGYHVYSGNALRNDHIAELVERINKISELSDSELRDLYRLWLQSRDIKATDTSLGLMDMARRTGNKIVYDFEPIDEEYSYFALRTTVNVN